LVADAGVLTGDRGIGRGKLRDTAKGGIVDC